MLRSRTLSQRLGIVSPKLSTSWTPKRGIQSKTAGAKAGLASWWTSEKLATTDKYPLSLELFRKMHPSTEEPQKKMAKSQARHSKNFISTRFARTQLVSPDLCDDVFKFYGKHLKMHKGCDILDINPGAGLWSQKLHDFLKPRSHVLLEPKPERFKTFLDPLLNAPKSKYKLVQKDTTDLKSYKELVDEGVFPKQKRVDPEENSGQELNPTLLVTGMLVWDPKLPGMSFDSMAKQLYNLFTSAIRNNELFHAYGRVRTLFWVSADDFSSVLAESSSTFQKNNCLLELSQDMELVVTAPVEKKGPGKSNAREPQYMLESMVLALQRARKNGMTIPEHRLSSIHRLATEIEEISGGTGRSESIWLHEFLINKHLDGQTPAGLLADSYFAHLEAAKVLQEKYPEVNLASIGNPQQKGKRRTDMYAKDHPGRAEIHSYGLKKAADRALVQRKAGYEALADIGEEMYNEECRALRMPPGSEKDALVKHIADLETKWEHGLSKVLSNYKIMPFSLVDDRLSLRSPPYPRFQWDRRAFEPMTMEPDEAWPPNRLSLISSTPLPRPAGQSVDWYEWLQDFVFALFAVPSQSVHSALDKMQHGASEIIESCPSLRNPDKGGRMNIHQLRVRMLTAEMIEELLQAYRDWPFKAPGSDHNKYFRWKGLASPNERYLAQ